LNNVLFVIPAAFYVFYLIYLGLRMFQERKNAVINGLLDPSFFKTYKSDQPVPDGIIVSGRHFDNQFQIPVVYQLAMLFALQLGVVNYFTIALNWIFFGSRVLHSFVHLGQNLPLKRAKAFAIGLVCLLLLWISIIVGLF